MFASEFEPVDLATRRRDTRAAVAIQAEMQRSGLTCALCKLIGLSLPGVPAIAVEVVWADDFAAGCRPRHPFDKPQFDLLAAHG